MSMVIAVANQKSRVGKTTTVVNLAHALATHGLRVLAVDNDPQSDLTIRAGHDPCALDRQGRTLWGMLIEDKNPADLVVAGPPDLLPASIRLASAEGELLREWNGATLLKERLRQLLPIYDVVLIDCPPALGLLAVNALAAAGLVLIPVKTDHLSLLGLGLLFETIERIRSRLNPDLRCLGVVPTMFDARNGHDREVLVELEHSLAARARLFSPIRRTAAFDETAVAAAPAMMDDTSHRVLAGYHELVEDILLRVRAAHHR